jgi:DHA2 family multidrug resistance protein
MAATDLFYLSSVLFFGLIAMVWLARPKSGGVAGGGGAH